MNKTVPHTKKISPKVVANIIVPIIKKAGLTISMGAIVPGTKMSRIALFIPFLAVLSTLTILDIKATPLIID